MSAGNAGHNGSGHQGDDDPFGYLYRPEGGAGTPPPQQPQQPSYNQVRAVGERRPQSGGYGYPPQRDPHYAAPEAQPGGPHGYGGGHGGGPPRGYAPNDDETPRRNRLLIGAIAGVTAVVLGVGAAVLFSGDEDGDGDDVAQLDPKPGEDDAEDEEAPEEEQPDADEDETEPEEDTPETLPEADLAGLSLSSGAVLGGGHVEGALTPDGSYIAGMENENATVTWEFEFDGPPGEYRLHVGYSVPEGDQEMSLAVNDAIRGDKLDFKDWLKQGSWEKNWTRTYKDNITLDEGKNYIHIGCVGDDTCEVIIDKIEITEANGYPTWRQS